MKKKMDIILLIRNLYWKNRNSILTLNRFFKDWSIFTKKISYIVIWNFLTYSLQEIKHAKLGISDSLLSSHQSNFSFIFLVKLQLKIHVVLVVHFTWAHRAIWIMSIHWSLIFGHLVCWFLKWSMVIHLYGTVLHMMCWNKKSKFQLTWKNSKNWLLFHRSSSKSFKAVFKSMSTKDFQFQI